ncbi:hypothetical protein L218DRAFT_841639, partial [Marasmius fiardii PR-910]
QQQPTLQKSWDMILNAIENSDEDVAKGYKEDIDTLLVFAGLFSAVVIAFAVESYQWLQEDPVDTAVALLTLISRQIDG